MPSKKLIAVVAVAASAILPIQSAFAEESTLTFANYRDIRDLNPHLYGGEILRKT